MDIERGVALLIKATVIALFFFFSSSLGIVIFDSITGTMAHVCMFAATLHRICFACHLQIPPLL